MSDSDKTAASNGSSPQFTERELQLLGWAMQSLKSGPPEIDYEKLAGYANMGNPRSASNAWAKIKIKLKLMSPAPEGTVPATPKKPRGRKPAAAKTEEEEGDASATPKKTPRKRGPKKQEVDGESSPKKKPARGNKASGDESVKADSDDAEDLKPNGSPVKIDPAEASDEVAGDEI
ncbi:hypothetical protein DDE82_001369 [Stemphylium lycopersici]|uniref:Uncharacterized protein n=1 Tax=Stemphylium lycopersici TaxID=183478 RepID=A0A364NE85_STELY|nr:hypothetical protein TW65_06766 [Stemphylium lycopersici]RAR10095.1 hypothetical protein DDE82_001369 [Stemphylium lycopersici]RAR15624.1 hypothetical protein DDE83_001074 [Stemphylium lycopersici]